MKVKPKTGLAVYDPETSQALPPEGATVPDNAFWRRKVRAGDVVLIDEPTGREPVTPLTTRSGR